MGTTTKAEAAEWVKSACPHDCPSACALEVEKLSPQRIGSVRGAKANDAAALGLTSGHVVRIGNRRGELTLKLKVFAGVQPGVIIVEGIWPNHDFAGSLGVNQLIGADRVPPNGGTAFHDTAVWLRAA